MYGTIIYFLGFNSSYYNIQSINQASISKIKKIKKRFDGCSIITNLNEVNQEGVGFVGFIENNKSYYSNSFGFFSKGGRLGSLLQAQIFPTEKAAKKSIGTTYANYSIISVNLNVNQLIYETDNLGSRSKRDDILSVATKKNINKALEEASLEELKERVRQIENQNPDIKLTEPERITKKRKM